MRSSSIVSLGVLLVSAVAAAQDSRPGKVIVDFASTTAEQAWIAAGLEQELSAELARFQRVTLVDKGDTKSCKDREPRCLLGLHAPRADVVVIGTLQGDRLEFEVHETATRSLAKSGSITVGGGLSPG